MNEVMTLTEVADYLQLAEKTVLRMAQKGKIPAAKVASQWRFLRPVIKDWLATQMQYLTLSAFGHTESTPQTGLSLMKAIRPDLMSLKIVAGSKTEVLTRLIEPLKRTGFATKPDVLLQGLIERERLMTTAVGHTIAIPHPRRILDGMFREPAVAMGICPSGTDFDAIDDQPVHLFFLICATREAIHLELMAKVAWLVRQQERMALLNCSQSPEQVLRVISEAMETLEPS